VARHGQVGWALAIVWLACGSFAQSPPARATACKHRALTFEGWKAEELSNAWVRLTIAPQLGGRLMQVEFGDHAYLFVNPKYRGQYIPPSEAGKLDRWINYGGDKLWPLPEGREDDQHWPGPLSDALDDGEYQSSVVSAGERCAVRLQGPGDPSTGLQYTREISIGGDSPQILFHASMKNASTRLIRWSMQSVTQYDTADHSKPGQYNRNFWAFAPLNPRSAYVDGYRVEAGLADDPSFSARDGIFLLHWLYLENEVWLDSDAGWLAVIDDATQYGMVEQFQHVADGEYPGKASLIFYKNGAALELDPQGMPRMRPSSPEQAPYYMEAEINSPIVRLQPGESYVMDTQWSPVRAGKDFRTLTPAGLVGRPLSACLSKDGIRIAGTFGTFFPGKLSAHMLDRAGAEQAVVMLRDVDPLEVVTVDEKLAPVRLADRVSLRLDGTVRHGTLGEASIVKADRDSQLCERCCG
jgi:hypothetical protein